MALTGAVYKWRLDNTSYAYITDATKETGGTPFIAINENNINEEEIKEKVVSWDEQTYCEQFETMVNIVHASGYTNLQFLDCSIYLSEFSDCPDEISKPLIPTDIALTVEATPDTVQAEFIDEGTIYSDGEFLKQFKLKLNIPTEDGGVEYTAGENINITTGNTISAMGYRYDQDKDSIAVGSGSVALGMYSHAEGIGTQANGEASHAEGYQTESRGNFTHTEGRETLVQGTCGHAEGYKTTSQYIASHAEGRETTSSADYSHAEGYGTQAKGTASHVEGYGTQANGEYSHAEGYSTKAWADFSHAEGETTIAYGDSSHAEGLGTITNNVGEHAEGKYNHSNSDTEDTNNIGLNTIHSIGIGNDDTDRKNAFEVMENGDVYVYNVGDYDGTNATDGAKTLQEVLGELNNSGGSGSGITYVGGNNIDITGNTITAKGYTYDTDTLEFSGNTLSLGGGNATIQYDTEEQRTTFDNFNGLKITADGEISINNTSDINITTLESDINISSENNIDFTSNNDMNITANGRNMNITATEGDINISSNNFSVDSSSFSSTCPITAEVNRVENVYLGCPIGTIVMWAGQTAPDGWLLCDGTGIPVYENNGSYMSKACTIQGKPLNDNELTHLVFTVFEKSPDGSDSLYGRANYYYVNEEQKWIKEGTRSVETGTTYFDITEYTTDVKEALKFYDTPIDAFRKNQAILTVIKYQCINLPDLQQKFPLGAQGGTISTYSTNLGNTGGESTHTLTENEMPIHDHVHSHTIDATSNPGTNVIVVANRVGGTGDAGPENSLTWTTDNNSESHSGGSQPHNNIPPFLAINFIIKYK